jgi:hypothetical protein
LASHLDPNRHNRPVVSRCEISIRSWRFACFVDAMPRLRIFILLLPLALLALAQEPKRFAGTWEAKFKDRVICTINLEVANPVSGNMHACNVNVNEDGDLIEPEGSDDKTDPILDPKLQGDTLSYSVKDEDGGEPLKFELKLTGEGHAELTFLNAPVKMKPIRFEKK